VAEIEEAYEVGSYGLVIKWLCCTFSTVGNASKMKESGLGLCDGFVDGVGRMKNFRKPDEYALNVA